jgi:hypothetical protein
VPDDHYIITTKRRGTLEHAAEALTDALRTAGAADPHAPVWSAYYHDIACARTVELPDGTVIEVEADRA